VVQRTLEGAVTTGSWGSFVATGVVYATGLAAGLLSLRYVRGVWRRRGPDAATVAVSMGPGAMAVAERDRARHEALYLGMSIASGIGLHNFSEGLAIGQAAHTGAIAFALLLVVGFALHNATEGFGIVGPLAAWGVVPSWPWLATAGIVGGGPTFLGTLVGSSLSSPLVFVGCLTLAAGGIVYVVGELFAAGRRLSWDLTLWGILAGFLIALATELVLVAAGA
jgi:ZIP family zinc transporter